MKEAQVKGVEVIRGLLRNVSGFLGSYESGDLLKLVSIKEGIVKLKEEFSHFEELQKLNGILDQLLGLIDNVSKFPQEEKLFISLATEIVNNLLVFFGHEISGRELIQRLNSSLSQLKELARTIATKKDGDTKDLPEEEGYPEDYFSSLVEDAKLLREFYHEATEHLNEAQFTLVELEHDSKNQELINNIFRNFHTIKGSSAFLGLKNIEELSHSIEDILALVRDGKILLSKELVDLIFYCIDFLRNLLDVMTVTEFQAAEMKKSFLRISIHHKFVRLMKRIAKEYTYKKIGEILEEEGKLIKEDLEYILSKQGETQKKFGDIAVEEKILSSEEVVGALQKQKQQEAKIKKLGFVKVSNEKLNSLVDIVGELVINQSMLKQEILSGDAHSTISERTLSQLEMITTTIKNLVISMGMLPIADVFNKLRVVARNTASELGKVVVVEMKGEETELDRNVIETIYDPLMHIIRNAIDHGIESPEERAKAGKEKIGRIMVSAEHKGSGIEIVIADDGRGIDKEKVLKKAIDLHLVDREKANTLTEKDIYNFMFLPRFSTSEKVTTVSGRGVGLDVVKKNLEQIHGRVEVYSELGKYTKFVIKIPLTLAIIEGFVTKVGDNKYVFPFSMIEEIVVLDKSEIKTSKDGNREELLIYHRGVYVPVIFAHRIFKEPLSQKERLIALLFNLDEFKYCVVVDEALGKQEIVIKGLSGALSEYDYFSGGTIFGDGSIGFVVDLQGLIEHA